MATHRFEIDATAGPAREAVIGGSMLLVRVRMFDGGDVANAFTGEGGGGEDVLCDLRPSEARELAFVLLACAEHAEQTTQQAGGWAHR
jgi:hypothetical protein